MKQHLWTIFFAAIWILTGAAALAANEALDRLLEDEKNTVQIFRQASPYVVYVHNIQKVADFFYNIHEVQAGTGSGFIWDDKGHVVTNYHVVQGARKISISIREGKTVMATVVGVEPKKDIAVLKINDTADFPTSAGKAPIPVADSAKLLVGQKAIAIGNPFGLDRTLTTGVISALGRQVPGIGGVTIRDMVQTDASINPGNSGGPLLNSSGELIGMNTVIYSPSGASSGVGFAVPSNTVKRTVEQILRYGRVIQPGLGIQRLDDSISDQLGIKGVITAEVIAGSPASKAGLKGTKRDSYGKIHLGDIIIAVDSKPVENYDDLYSALEKKKIGDDVSVTFLRDNKKHTVLVKLIDLSAE